MRRLLSAATVVAAFLLPDVARACDTADDVYRAVDEVGFTISHEFRGNDAVAWTAGFNALPPRSSIMADHVILIDRLGHPKIFIWFLLAECVVGWGELNRSFAADITDTVLGAPS